MALILSNSYSSRCTSVSRDFDSAACACRSTGGTTKDFVCKGIIMSGCVGALEIRQHVLAVPLVTYNRTIGYRDFCMCQ